MAGPSTGDAMTVSTVAFDDPPLLLEQFLTGYWSARTRANYAFIIGGWFTWCAGRGHYPLRDADPRVIERWITEMQHRPYAAKHHRRTGHSGVGVLPVVRPRAATQTATRSRRSAVQLDQASRPPPA